MNRDRIYLGIVTAMIIMVIIYASYGLLNGGKEELHYSVSVVIDNSGSDQWNAFKEGLNQGANESGIYLNIVSASTFSGLAEEYMILERELENGADGVITALCDTSESGWKTGEDRRQKPDCTASHQIWILRTGMRWYSRIHTRSAGQLLRWF